MLEKVGKSKPNITPRLKKNFSNAFHIANMGNLDTATQLFKAT